MANLMLYVGTHSIGACGSLLHIIIIIIIISIIIIILHIIIEDLQLNVEVLTGVGELNPD